MSTIKIYITSPYTVVLPLFYDLQDIVYLHPRALLAWWLEIHSHSTKFLRAFLRRVGQRQQNFQGRADELGPIELR